MLSGKDGSTIISNEALASITLFVATSKPDEMGAVKKLIVSILNRNILQITKADRLQLTHDSQTTTTITTQKFERQIPRHATAA